MNNILNYTGSKITKFFKWVSAISGTAAGIYGLIGQFYPGLPFYVQIGTAGACLAGIATIIVGKTKPETDTYNDPEDYEIADSTTIEPDGGSN